MVVICATNDSMSAMAPHRPSSRNCRIRKRMVRPKRESRSFSSVGDSVLWSIRSAT